MFTDYAGTDPRDEYGYTADGLRSMAQCAFEGGRTGNTFATASEYRHPVHNAAWTLGDEYRRDERPVEPHTLIGCGCPSCRFERLLRGTIAERKD